MHKGKEKKKPPQLTWFVPDTQDFLFVAVQIMDGREREVVCFILPDRSEFDLWYYCVCASITAVYSQLMTRAEVPFERPPALLHPHHAALALQKSVSIRAEFCILQCFLPYWSAISGSWQISFWTHAGSPRLLSGSWVTVFNAKHISSSPSSTLTTPYAVPSDYFNIIHNTASPIAYLCCLEQPSYLSATSILQLLPNFLQNPSLLSLLSSLGFFLLWFLCGYSS